MAVINSERLCVLCWPGVMVSKMLYLAHRMEFMNSHKRCVGPWGGVFDFQQVLWRMHGIMHSNTSIWPLELGSQAPTLYYGLLRCSGMGLPLPSS